MKHGKTSEYGKGDVIVIPFPFSDLTKSKKRPAYVVANIEGEDIILCQITSKGKKDGYSIPLRKHDFSSGELHIESLLRTNKLFTADNSLILKKIGELKKSKQEKIEDKLVKIFKD